MPRLNRGFLSASSAGRHTPRYRFLKIYLFYYIFPKLAISFIFAVIIESVHKYRYLVLAGIVLFALLISAFLILKKQPQISDTPAIPAIITETAITPMATSGGWKTFSDPAIGLSFKYPPYWTVREEGLSFQDGDLLVLQIWGQTQKTQTELYDGASFAVMKPIESPLEISDWVIQKYDQESPEEKPVYSEEKFGDKTYEKAYLCGLGCFSYYHIKENGKIYGFVYSSIGPDKISYDSDFNKIMESISYSIQK